MPSRDRYDPFRIEDARVISINPQSLTFVADLFDDPVTVPYSEIHDDSDLWKESDVGEVGTLIVSGWLANVREWV